MKNQFENMNIQHNTSIEQITIDRYNHCPISHKNQQINTSFSHLNIHYVNEFYKRNQLNLEHLEHLHKESQGRKIRKDYKPFTSLVSTFKGTLSSQLNKWANTELWFFKQKFGKRFVEAWLHFDETKPHWYAKILNFDYEKNHFDCADFWRGKKNQKGNRAAKQKLRAFRKEHKQNLSRNLKLTEIVFIHEAKEHLENEMEKSEQIEQEVMEKMSQISKILDLNPEEKKVLEILENEFRASEGQIYDLRKKNITIQKKWKYQVEKRNKLKKENQELKQIIGLQKHKIDEDFVNLKSKYSKLMYKKIHEFRTTEKLQWKIETFRAEFGVPKSYRIDSINERIFKIVKRELTPLFNNFQITKIKKEHKKSHVIRAKVEGIEITWKYASDQTQLINTTEHSLEGQNKKLLDIAFRVPIEIQKWVMKFKRQKL